MQDPAFRADQRNQMYAPHVEPINRLVDELASQGLGWVPRVAPVHGGFDAQVLLVLRDPGPAVVDPDLEGTGFLLRGEPRSDRRAHLRAAGPGRYRRQPDTAMERLPPVREPSPKRHRTPYRHRAAPTVARAAPSAAGRSPAGYACATFLEPAAAGSPQCWVRPNGARRSSSRRRPACCTTESGPSGQRHLILDGPS